jgi:ribosome-associated translation inhibitor RaiA
MVMVIRSSIAKRTIIVSENLQMEVRGRWHRIREKDYDTGETRITLILRHKGLRKRITMSAVASIDEAPILLERHSVEVAKEDADMAADAAVGMFLLILGLGLQHRTGDMAKLLLTRFDYESKLYRPDPRDVLSALELSSKLGRLIRISYAYIHCDITLSHPSKADEIEVAIGRRLAEFSWDRVERTLDLRPLISQVSRGTLKELAMSEI